MSLSNEIRKASGEVNVDGKLVCFFYLLLRDHLPSGAVAEIVGQIYKGSEYQYSNGWLVKEAEFYIEKLLEESEQIKE